MMFGNPPMASGSAAAQIEDHCQRPCLGAQTFIHAYTQKHTHTHQHTHTHIYIYIHTYAHIYIHVYIYIYIYVVPPFRTASPFPSLCCQVLSQNLPISLPSGAVPKPSHFFAVRCCPKTFPFLCRQVLSQNLPISLLTGAVPKPSPLFAVRCCSTRKPPKKTEKKKQNL